MGIRYTQDYNNNKKEDLKFDISNVNWQMFFFCFAHTQIFFFFFGKQDYHNTSHGDTQCKV